MQFKNGKKFQRSRSKSRGYQGPQSAKPGSQTDKAENQNKSLTPCNGCGANHHRSQCPYRNTVCRACQKIGHIYRACRAKQQQKQYHQQETNAVESLQPADSIDTTNYLRKIEVINAMQSGNKAILCVQLEGERFEMELDTAAASGITGSKTLEKVVPDFKSRLLPSDKAFADYSYNRLLCLGRILVQVTFGKTTKNLFLYVIERNYDSLFGREWIREFVNEINWNEIFKPQTIHTVSTSSSPLTAVQGAQLDKLLEKYSDVFKNTAGKMTGPPVKMHLKPNSSPVFAKAHEIPFALRDAYAKEIDLKIASGFYERVKYSEWASTTHVVAKKMVR